jgi:hypothetical protein
MRSLNLPIYFKANIVNLPWCLITTSVKQFLNSALPCGGGGLCYLPCGDGRGGGIGNLPSF